MNAIYAHWLQQLQPLAWTFGGLSVLAFVSTYFHQRHQKAFELLMHTRNQLLRAREVQLGYSIDQLVPSAARLNHVKRRVQFVSTPSARQMSTGRTVSVQAGPPALVILNMNLRDGLGMDIIKPLKQLSPAVLIAVFTIHADPSYSKRCMALGAAWFLDKATRTDALLEVVRQHAALKPSILSNQGTLHV